jgi:hypothetical protein
MEGLAIARTTGTSVEQVMNYEACVRTSRFNFCLQQPIPDIQLFNQYAYRLHSDGVSPMLHIQYLCL